MLSGLYESYWGFILDPELLIPPSELVYTLESIYIFAYLFGRQACPRQHTSFTPVFFKVWIGIQTYSWWDPIFWLQHCNLQLRLSGLLLRSKLSRNTLSAEIAWSSEPSNLVLRAIYVQWRVLPFLSQGCILHSQTQWLTGWCVQQHFPWA